MIIEQALMTKLNAISALTALTSTHIYFVKAPQDVAKPYLVFQKISAPRGYTYAGPDGMVTARFQFTAFAVTYKECKDTLEALRGGLSGYQGVMGGTGGITVGFCDYDNETDLYNEDAGLFGVAADYLINYTEE
jgi:hypothetical protein